MLGRGGLSVHASTVQQQKGCCEGGAWLVCAGCLWCELESWDGSWSLEW
eukprot:SAG25_NODE_95_length_15927_cov_8.666224_2_plen_49_part_00